MVVPEGVRGDTAPRSGKIEQFVGGRRQWGKLWIFVFVSQIGERKNKLSALNVINKSVEEFLRENRGRIMWKRTKKQTDTDVAGQAGLKP